MSGEERQSVMVVDDDTAEIELLNEILKDVCSVRVTKNGRGAIKRAVLNKPDLILLDVIMPDIDGFEVLRNLKELSLTRDIPVIFITSLADAASEERALSMGAADYITKPFDTDVVRARVIGQLKAVAKSKRVGGILGGGTGGISANEKIYW